MFGWMICKESLFLPDGGNSLNSSAQPMLGFPDSFRVGCLLSCCVFSPEKNLFISPSYLHDSCSSMIAFITEQEIQILNFLPLSPERKFFELRYMV